MVIYRWEIKLQVLETGKNIKYVSDKTPSVYKDHTKHTEFLIFFTSSLT